MLRKKGRKKRKKAELKEREFIYITTRKSVDTPLKLELNAVDVLDAYSNYIIKSESDGKVILKERENVCKKADFQELCSLPADETHVFTYSYKLTAIPSFFKMLTVNGRWQLFNQDGIMFFCLDAVAKGH
nr:uncharacterized protein LOC131794439 [Pocillopora verrucosa]